MSCTVEKISSNQVKMNITIPAEDFAKGIDKSYRALRGRINVPGFRRGKAPRAVIERLYGKEIFYENYVFTIKSVKDRRIEQVMMKILKDESNDG